MFEALIKEITKYVIQKSYCFTPVYWYQQIQLISLNEKLMRNMETPQRGSDLKCIYKILGCDVLSTRFLSYLLHLCDTL